MKKQYYVMHGHTPEYWAEQKPLGPYSTLDEAMKAISKDMRESLDGCESLSPGIDDKFAEPYWIVESIKTVQPVVKVGVSLTFDNVEP